MSEKFEQIVGLALISDPTGVKPGYLTGGQNMLKRNHVGLVRRPGYGALNVQSNAAISVGATSPRACFPFAYYGKDPNIMGFANGVLSKYDGADSFDQVTKNLTDDIPSFCSLGEFGIFASGGRVLKYDGNKTPSPVGSELIADMEPNEIWDDANGRSSDDTSNEYTGTQCKLITLAVSQDETLTFTSGDSLLDTGSLGISSVGYIGDVGGQEYDHSVVLLNDSGADVDISKIRFQVLAVTGSPTGNLTVSLQRVGGDNKPDGTDLESGTVDLSTLSDGDYVPITLSGTVTILNGDSIAVVFDAVAQSTNNYIEIYRGNDFVAGWAQLNGAGWYNNTYGAWVQLLSASSDLETGYAPASEIRFRMKVDTVANFDIGAGSYIKFIVEAGVTEATYQFVAGDISTGWYELKLARGTSDDGTAADSDFTYTGTMDWSAITSVEIMVTEAGNGALNVYLDYMYLLGTTAPPASGKVFRADNRVWIPVGGRVYYSDQYNANSYQSDGYIDFADDVVGVVDAGQRVLVLTESESHIATPLEIIPAVEGTPLYADYDVRRLSPYGCSDKNSCMEITYKGVKGAAWLSKNHGIWFYDGERAPQPISAGIQDIFTDGEADTVDFDHTRPDEAVMIYNPRWNEMWLFYPSLTSGETNITYAWVLDCDSGEWMPQFVWANTEKIVHASVIRDSADGLYKIHLTDTDGKVFVEGFADGTALTSSTSRDGYVDSTDKGNVVVPFIDTWWFHGDGQEILFHEVLAKLKPNTTNAMELNVDYGLGVKSGDVDNDTYPYEENIQYPDSFTDLLQRSFTMGDVDNVVTRNMYIQDELTGHAIRFRVGMQDIVNGDTDFPEFEIIGVSVKGAEEGGT